uniref:Uncharacterized protein n=1 Tax=Podarcis muralis TaxID=64176 RepID=A0A670IBC0_PODMU
MERMSWLSKLNPRAGAGGHRGTRGASLQSPMAADPETCLMVFKNHWVQVLRILEKSPASRGAQGGAADDLSAVRNHTLQMLTLLAEERPRAEGSPGPILELALAENVLGRLLAWHLRRGEPPEERKAELLKLYEMLLGQAHQPLLRYRPVLGPLLRLLGLCAGPASPALEGSLVLLLHQLCVSAAREPPCWSSSSTAPHGGRAGPRQPAGLLPAGALHPPRGAGGAAGQRRPPPPHGPVRREPHRRPIHHRQLLLLPGAGYWPERPVLLAAPQAGGAGGRLALPAAGGLGGRPLAGPLHELAGVLQCRHPGGSPPGPEAAGGLHPQRVPGAGPGPRLAQDLH